tara:strand:+ start:1373 stop:1570 length:198 start_codon:yes stop_codon:yes gene_type:complete
MSSNGGTSKRISPVIEKYLESIISHTIKSEDLDYLRSIRNSMSSAESRVYSYLKSCIEQKRFKVN